MPGFMKTDTITQQYNYNTTYKGADHKGQIFVKYVFKKSEEVNSNLAVIDYSPGEKKIDLKKRMLNEYKALSRFCCGAHLYPLQTQYADQLLVGLLTQLVERCTGIAEDMNSNPVQA